MIAAPLATLAVQYFIKLFTGGIVEMFRFSDFIAASVSVSIAALISACKYDEIELDSLDKIVSKNVKKGDIVFDISGRGAIALVMYATVLFSEITNHPEQNWIRLIVQSLCFIYSIYNAYYCFKQTSFYEVKIYEILDNT